ncbi:hypothetical protein FA95DRAFT_1605242 [Auriscalpium vulgare]|uniref:Uncharacterized protein n=1 Tax=Auriscalpium vulgare TaxID=40419 RepID=A0ACB8RY26_9AGAM|nr:hypothetical protein FA95DRAFT_1605242 [Auriscalpium vulgare]
MGLTPVDGLHGAIDPTPVFHYTHRAGRITHGARNVDITEAETILNKKARCLRRAVVGTTDFDRGGHAAARDEPVDEPLVFSGDIGALCRAAP